MGMAISRSNANTLTNLRAYTFWWHPHLSWFERVLAVFVGWLLPLDKQNKDRKVFHLLRQRVSSIHTASAKSSLSTWSKTLGSPLLEYRVSLPRGRPGALLKANFGYNSHDKQDDPNIEKNDVHTQASPQEEKEDTHLTVMVRIPLSACRPDQLPDYNKDETNAMGCHQVALDNNNNKLNLATLVPPTVPVCVTFHGGGLTLGEGDDDAALDLALAASNLVQKPLVVVSVEYRLAPEHAFPAAVEDALQAVEFVLDQLGANRNNKNPVHVVAASAGSLLGTIVAMEWHRRQPGQIQSAILMCPMLNPLANSTSYFQCHRFSPTCPVLWLRGCWRFYLNLTAPQVPKEEEEAPPEEENSLTKLLNQDSTYDAWWQSPWAKAPLSVQRFINPLWDVPRQGWRNDQQDGSATAATSTRFVVTTNRADPLLDDGKALVRALQGDCGATVKHLDHPGLHYVGSRIYSSIYKEVVVACADEIFPLQQQQH